MSELEKIADAVRGFGDTADGPLAAAHALLRQLDALGDEAARLNGSEAQRMRAALDGAAGEARKVVASLDEFRQGAAAFADRLVSGGGAGSGGVAMAVGSVALSGAAMGGPSAGGSTGGAFGGGGDPERLSSGRSPEFEPQPRSAGAAAATDSDPETVGKLGGAALLSAARDPADQDSAEQHDQVDANLLTDLFASLAQPDARAHVVAAEAAIAEAGANPAGVARPNIRIEPPDPDDPSIQGVYRSGSQEILIHPEGLTPRLTTVHEIGHLLDHAVMGAGPGYASKSDDPGFAAWREAVVKSPEYREIDRIYSLPSTELAKIGAPAWKTARYLRMTTELWGRSYAQYVALKSSDEIMKSEVRRFGSHPDPLLANRQWSERSFAPIAEAIEAILQSKGPR